MGQRSSSAGNGLSEGQLGEVLGYQLAKASAVVDRVFERHVGKATDLKPVEFSLLALAHHNLGIGPARLADCLAISRPRASQLLDHLAERRLIERLPCAADGRGFEIHLTPAASHLVGEALGRLQAAERAATRCLSEAELAMLLELLNRVAELAAASEPPV
jgi:DNA-binding MarR family transcriptional regulator